jgi:hypothetical protein
MNPQAEPRMSASSHVDTANEGMWRSGRLLICRRDAHFPDRCVKSNDPVGPQRTRLKLRWFHPMLFLAGTSSTANKARESETLKVTLNVGLCDRCLRKFRLLKRLATIWLAVSLAALVTGLLWNSVDFFVIWGGIGLLVGLVFERFFARMLIVKEINARYVKLRGAAPDFLAELPEWPGGKR